MAKKGLRLDVRKYVKSVQGKLRGITASDFRPEMARHASRTLKSAVSNTPTRNLSVIKRNQAFQYDARVNYIPSVHELSDPTLIVKDGVYWLYANGRWWAASYHSMPSDIQSILEELLDERNRRLETSVGAFVNERAQARFLYRQQWWQVAKSIGVPLSVSSEVRNAHSRPYHDPARNPARGYGQWRGGKHVLAIVIYTPFLNVPTKFWREKSGKQILEEAARANYSTFMGEVAAKLNSKLHAV